MVIKLISVQTILSLLQKYGRITAGGKAKTKKSILKLTERNMIEIVNMKKEHTDDVLRMMRKFYASPAVSTNGSEEIFKSDIENCINNNPYLEGYVFTDGKAVIGYSMIAKSFSTEFGKPCVWIEDIYLTPQYRGKGIASQFFAFIEKNNPKAIFRLEVEEENEYAVRAYRKNGFDVLPYMEMKK